MNAGAPAGWAHLQHGAALGHGEAAGRERGGQLLAGGRRARARPRRAGARRRIRKRRTQPHKDVAAVVQHRRRVCRGSGPMVSAADCTHQTGVAGNGTAPLPRLAQQRFLAFSSMTQAPTTNAREAEMPRISRTPAAAA